MGSAFQSTDAAFVLGQLDDDSWRERSVPDVSAPWPSLLGGTIASGILPWLIAAHRPEVATGGSADAVAVAAFVALIVADDMDAVRAAAAGAIERHGGRDALLHGLLTPAARELGELWSRDECDFLTVTLGVYRLDQVMKETATACHSVSLASGHDRRILLLPAPGEQHSFGLAMVADVFRDGGWCVRSGPAVPKMQLVRLVRDEWFDVIGLSVSAERTLKGLSSAIRAVRAASRNPGVYIMLGGPGLMDHVERHRFLGADCSAADAQEALKKANDYMISTVTKCLHRSKTGLVDIG